MAEAKAAGRVVLSDAVEPFRYKVRLEPDLEKFIFDGTESVSVEVKEATDEVTMHAKEIAIRTETVVFKPEEGEELKPVEIKYNLKDTTVTFKFESMLPVGEGVLEMQFIGCLNDQMAGFYRSSYKDITGKSKIMASTQFESLDARRAFPCWDEPARKAVFAVTLVVDAGLTAFSNMPETSSKSINGGKKVELEFMDSPKMSTYLLAFVVGEFDFIQAQTKHGVLVRVYAPPGRSADGQFALSVATKALDGYDDYFGIPYPLPKLDMVAIPEFAAGAMENWGLVTYREVDLLIGPSASSQQKQRVCIVVTHELAHQWFGNLVTMMWWDDLWLNEGFASWAENYMADLIFPDYAMWDQFTADTQGAALRLDSLRSSHPIQVPIHRAEEVEEVFDAISYCKGAAVIRMAHAYLGAEDFRKGLASYFQKHSYSNTETLDLWAAWGEASGKPVSDLMASWTEQMGFPLLTMTSFEATATSATFTLEQEWFLADGSLSSDDDKAKLWKIPVMCSSGAGVAEMVLMTDRSLTMTVKLSGADDFVKVNAGQFVPTRVLYTEEALRRLLKGIEQGKLPVPDRAGLVLDTYALAKSGKLGADSMVRVLAAYRNETSFCVWDGMSQVLNGLNRLLMAGLDDDVYTKYVAFAASLVKGAFFSVGWEKREADGHLDARLRETLVKLAASYSKDEAIVEEARRRFDAFFAGDSAQLPDDIKPAVFQIVLKTGGNTEFDALKGLWAKAETNIEKKHVYTTIGHTAEFAKKKEVLEWAISGEIKIQDFFYALGSVSSSSKAAGAMSWQFYKDNFNKMHSMLKTANPSLMDAAIQTSTTGLCSAAGADEVEAFFKEHPLPQNQRKISQIVEDMRTNGKFLDRILQTPLADAAFWDQL